MNRGCWALLGRIIVGTHRPSLYAFCSTTVGRTVPRNSLARDYLAEHRCNLRRGFPAVALDLAHRVEDGHFDRRRSMLLIETGALQVPEDDLSLITLGREVRQQDLGEPKQVLLASHMDPELPTSRLLALPHATHRLMMNTSRRENSHHALNHRPGSIADDHPQLIAGDAPLPLSRPSLDGPLDGEASFSVYDSSKPCDVRVVIHALCHATV